MGCCLSTNKTSTSQKKHNVGSESLSLQKTSFSESRAPPPSVEEETVKEVLSSETPKPKPQVSISETLKVPKQQPHFPQQQQQQQDKKPHNNPVFDNKINKTKDDISSMSLSEVSEICCESVSTVTDQTRDYEDEEEEVKQKLVVRSPAKFLPPPRNRVGNRVVGKSPTRISEQSPGRRNGSVRSGQGIVRSGGSRPDPNRREPGESSVRRSRSPASNRSVMGRSPSVRRTNRSPGRVRLDPAESSSNNSNNNMKVKWPQSNSATTTTSSNESLENPLVSLECFIFL